MLRKFEWSKKEVKGLICKENGRSSDYISPSFILGCAGRCSFCTVYYNNPSTIKIATNVDQILESIELQFSKLPKKIPNQCGDKWTIDIGCNTDISLHFKHLNWFKVFDKLVSLNIMPTFATKFVNYNLLDYSPKPNTIRIRYSLLPQKLSNVLFPLGATNADKFTAMNYAFIKGWQVHQNLSPVVLYQGWLKDYEELFIQIKDSLNQEVIDQLLSEVIFLTYNESLHNLNLKEEYKYENLLWNPHMQEEKTSTMNKGRNLRYKYQLKKDSIEKFKDLYFKYFNEGTIRYIF